MSRGKRYSTEQIIGFLREVEVVLSQGHKLGDVCRELGISEQRAYRWRQDLWRSEDGSGPAIQGTGAGERQAAQSSV